MKKADSMNQPFFLQYGERDLRDGHIFFKVNILNQVQ